MEESAGCDHILLFPLLKGSDSFWESQNQMHVTGITASKVTPIYTSEKRGRCQAKLKGNFPWRLPPHPCLDRSTGMPETCVLLPFHLFSLSGGFWPRRGVTPLGLTMHQCSSSSSQLSVFGTAQADGRRRTESCFSSARSIGLHLPLVKFPASCFVLSFIHCPRAWEELLQTATELPSVLLQLPPEKPNPQPRSVCEGECQQYSYRLLSVLFLGASCAGPGV